MKPMSQIIRERLVAAGVPFFANDNISEHITENERTILQEEVEGKVRDMLNSLVIDIENDHNSMDTAKRVAKMYVQEIYSGRYQLPPRITSFPNAKSLDEMYTSGPISVRSVCSHHMQSVIGKCWVGVIPGEDVIGLSKFNRVVEWFASRGQIQEEMTVQIADHIEKLVKPRGLAVVIKATHGCMICRGVKESADAAMTTSVMRGKLFDNYAARAEFFQLINLK
jgi:GTP cyclohydrolase I